ncbi:hypothetical protein [Streptococcus merionis]|uniref:hypothetical protein n=1 Tax=Streptococcus merionis TaxID=400065 RepID=UPI00351565EE
MSKRKDYFGLASGAGLTDAEYLELGRLASKWKNVSLDNDVTFDKFLKDIRDPNLKRKLQLKRDSKTNPKRGAQSRKNALTVEQMKRTEKRVFSQAKGLGRFPV